MLRFTITITIILALLATISILAEITISSQEFEYFTNTWAVRIVGGFNKAKKVAERLEYDLFDAISESIPHIYLFIDPKYPEETEYAAESMTTRLKQQPEISWVEQQVAEPKELRRHLRKAARRKTAESLMSWDDSAEALQCPATTSSQSVLNLNDKYWHKQSYIKDCSQGGSPNDLNLAPVWVKHRLFGKGIKVIVVDTGVDTKHLDIKDNYDPLLGLDVLGNGKKPDPPLFRRYPRSERDYISHGTRCAGIIGMKANNTVCGVGIAPLVTLGAVRMFDLRLPSDYKVATALLFKHVDVHISSNSWGPPSDGSKMPYTGPLVRSALKVGVTQGRHGKGLIYVFCAGNGRTIGDNCGCDSFVSSIYTISVATCNYRGKLTIYSERCPSVMVTTYTAKVAPGVGREDCTIKFEGTSAAAPVVSGAIALVLEANPTLSWRDVQHLLVWTCQVAPLQYNPLGTWEKNGAGFYISHDFGFGMLNINDLIEQAKVFRSVGPMHSCVTRANMNALGDAGEAFGERVRIEITSDGCEGTPSEVAYLEHVQLTVSLGFPRRGDLKISLTSPSGTKARLLEPRPYDSSFEGIRSWAFDSVMTWGESPKGKWTILIIGKKRKDGHSQFKSSVKKFWSRTKHTVHRSTRTQILFPDHDYALDDSVHIGEINDLTLTFHGTSKNQMPEHYKRGPRSYYDFTLPNDFYTLR